MLRINGEDVTVIHEVHPSLIYVKALLDPPFKYKYVGYSLKESLQLTRRRLESS